ncbi:MAG: protein kinase [Acidobacteria bacterium]|nr:protein kinase [Acidobacteriota bacterium]MBV9475923.1 protein kinase [Acidobacteriota bacterium]
MLAPGTRLGPYTIVALLGAGGMGEVYRAEDARLRREVAIKVLPEHLENDKQALDRFRREARAVAALSHPNIVSLFDFGSEENVHYAVTELLEGETLRMRIARGRFSPRAALETMLEIADGVAAAHARGIVHRDLKPENIFITMEGRVKVLDFGLARGATGIFAPYAADAVLTEIRPTEPGIVLGTIGYMAPEQIEGRSPATATDIFALGCILYEMVAGRLPFERASSAHVMVALLHDATPRLQPTGEPLLREVDTLIQHCLEKNMHDRPRDAGELASKIRAMLAGERVTWSRSSRAPRLAPRLLAFAALLLIVTGAALLVYRVRNRPLDDGYDLRASDVRGDGETTRLIELALRADAEGNRPKAIELFEEAWRRPAPTAIPAAFLSSFADAAGNNAEALRWGEASMKRMPGASTYESLLVRYLVVPAADPGRELALAKSALELRPSAWRLHLAAAHIYLGQRDRDAARAELQQIDVHKPDDRRLALVLADRASLGDVAGAERDLRASRLARRPALYHYAEARFAWSRGQAAKARELFDRAADDAASEGVGTLEAESRQLAGMALLRLGNWDGAERHFALTLTRARQLNLTYRVFEASALSAYAAQQQGDAEERDARLNDAYAVDPPSTPTAALRLLAMTLGSNVWQHWSTKSIDGDPSLAPVRTLLRAREAFFRGDRALAARELQRARAEDIDTSEVRENAELLARQLGLPSQRLPPDPPYPNILRWLDVFSYERAGS